MEELTEADHETLYRACDSFGGLSSALYGPPDDDAFIKTEEPTDSKLDPADAHQARIERMLPPVPFQIRCYLQDVLIFVYRLNARITVTRPDAIFSCKYDFMPLATRQAYNDKVRAGWQALSSPNSDSNTRRQAQLILVKLAQELRKYERVRMIEKYLPEVWGWLVQKGKLGADGKREEAMMLAYKVNMFFATLTAKEKDAVRRWVVKKNMEGVGKQFGGVAVGGGGVGGMGIADGMGTVNGIGTTNGMVTTNRNGTPYGIGTTNGMSPVNDMGAVNGMSPLNGIGNVNSMGALNGMGNIDTMGNVNNMATFNGLGPFNGMGPVNGTEGIDDVEYLGGPRKF